MKLKSSFLRHFSLVGLIACASTRPIQIPVETVNVDVPLEVGLSFVPRLLTLRIDYQDRDGLLGLTSYEEIIQIIPVYGGVPGNNMSDQLSPEQAYYIYLKSKR